MIDFDGSAKSMFFCSEAWTFLVKVSSGTLYDFLGKGRMGVWKCGLVTLGQSSSIEFYPVS